MNRLPSTYRVQKLAKLTPGVKRSGSQWLFLVGRIVIVLVTRNEQDWSSCFLIWC